MPLTVPGVLAALDLETRSMPQHPHALLASRALAHCPAARASLLSCPGCTARQGKGHAGLPGAWSTTRNNSTGLQHKALLLVSCLHNLLYFRGFAHSQMPWREDVRQHCACSGPSHRRRALIMASATWSTQHATATLKTLVWHFITIIYCIISATSEFQGYVLE